MKAVSNVWNAAIKARMPLKKRVGEIIGSVICQKRSRVLAPSIDAASYSSCGMPCRPARKMTIMLPPMAAHSATSIRAGRAQLGSLNQPGPLEARPVKREADLPDDLVQQSVLWVQEPQPDEGRRHDGGQMRHEED